MDKAQIKEYEVTLRAKFLANPLLYIMIFCAIFGIIIPFFKAIIPDGNVTVKDLTVLKHEVEKIQKTYLDASNALDFILSGISTEKPIKLPYDKRETLKLLAYERRSVFSAFMSFIAFLLQGLFFISLGLLLEHRFNLFRQIMPKNTIVSNNKDNDSSISEDTAADVEFEEDSQEEFEEDSQEEVKENTQEEAQEEAKEETQEEAKENTQEEFEEESDDDSDSEFEEESKEKVSKETTEL